MKETELERSRKALERRKMEESGWEIVRDIGKWMWSYHKVPLEQKVMMVELPTRYYYF